MDEVITFVEKLIPDISQTQFSLLRSRFEDIGISTIENLTYLNVEDLTDILKLVPARRFIAEVKRRLNIADVGNLSSASAESTYQTDHSTSTWLLNSSATGCASSASSSFSDDTRSGSPSITQLWSQSFNIPWEKFSKSFLEDCEKKKRPDESMRREAIRILCQSMREVCTKPNSKDIHVIAAKFVNEYKESLGDMIMGKMIGNGYSSVLSSMTERLNNLNRKTSNGPSIEYDSSKVSSQKYGCLSTWSIDIDSEEEQGMVEKRDWMKNEFMKSKNTSCLSTITEYMKETYPLQRKTINTGSTDDVRKDFPYLFEKQFMAVHFERLTGHSLDNYKKSEKKKFSVIHFLRKEKSPVLRKAIADMDFYVKETNHHIKLIAFVKLLMVSFKEDGLLEFYQVC
ncbi:uncharacterized protein LOC126813677 [Patella vulgata]|uniref:uncharacterized protein LOC126813677 n=1 Tax=Patella vulgata TaxID=6465 RepID=UPI0024A87ECB|nr:uncharacterized protein LOC126813677 [Patella vulgata]